jgi:glycosyltransferase involved in cell wall biosynthesis
VIVHVRDCLPASRTADVTRRLIAARATKVLANSRYTAGHFRRGGGSDEVEVVYSSVDLKRFDPARLNRAQARAQLDVSPEALVLGVVGQITPWKGQATAIEALALLRKRFSEAQLLIVGSVKFSSGATRHDNESYLRSLQRMVDELQLHEDVRFLGERSDVPEILGALDLLLLPSWEEPFGRTMVEAMATGTPVVATSIGGPAEVIEDHVNGRLLPPREPRAWVEAIEELIADPQLRMKMAAKGRDTATRFSRSSHVERVLTVYRQALAARAGV